MINDTSFFCNSDYNEVTDTIDTLDFEKMTGVVNSTYRAIINLYFKNLLQLISKQMRIMDDFEFKCSRCDEIHKGVPGFGTKAPIYYFGMPEDQLTERTELTSDTCVIDKKEYFVRGCLELPVMSSSEPFIFGAWVSLSQDDFLKFLDLADSDIRDNESPMVGWFSSWFWKYEKTERLKARIYFRNNGVRPWIELEPTDHPLAIAQRDGLIRQEVIEIYEYYTFDKG